MQAQLQEKFEDVVDLLDKNLANPDLELTYHIPDVAMTVEDAHTSGDPYILMKYLVKGLHLHEQEIPIKENYMKKTPEDLANLLTFFIEQHIEQIESVEGGAQ